MSKMEKENEPFADDLDWLAFCYVANELTGEQLIRFESRLADDQHARDAVVRAMNLAADVYSTEKHSAEKHSAKIEPGRQSVRSASRWASRRKWMWQTAVAVLIGTSLGAWLWTTSGDGDSTLAETPSEELAIAWVDSLEENELEELEFEPGDEFGFDDESTHEWMLAAIGELEESELESVN